MTIVTYLIIGIIWAMLFEAIDDNLGQKVLSSNDYGVRLMLIFAWPITMIIFIIALISNFNN